MLDYRRVPSFSGWTLLHSVWEKRGRVVPLGSPRPVALRDGPASHNPMDSVIASKFEWHTLVRCQRTHIHTWGERPWKGVLWHLSSQGMTGTFWKSKSVWLRFVFLDKTEIRWRTVDTVNTFIWYIYIYIIYLAILCDLFGMAKRPFQRFSDLQLGDIMVTLNPLV